MLLQCFTSYFVITKVLTSMKYFREIYCRSNSIFQKKKTSLKHFNKLTWFVIDYTYKHFLIEVVRKKLDK